MFALWIVNHINHNAITQWLQGQYNNAQPFASSVTAFSCLALSLSLAGSPICKLWILTLNIIVSCNSYTQTDKIMIFLESIFQSDPYLLFHLWNYFLSWKSKLNLCFIKWSLFYILGYSRVLSNIKIWIYF